MLSVCLYREQVIFSFTSGVSALRSSEKIKSRSRAGHVNLNI